MEKMIKKGNLFYPSKSLRKKAWISSPRIYKEAQKNPIKFWEKVAKELVWFKKWNKIFVHKPPYFHWFVGGKTNITYNIFERNFELGRKNKVAFIWEPEPTNERPRIYTYYQLYKEVNKLANALKKLGVKKGDVVGIYLPMIPEVIISMLACARIGAIHTVVFSAFSSKALQIRLNDTQAKFLITADGYYRRGKLINLKEKADEGIKGTKVKKVIVVKRANNKVKMKKGRDYWYHELIENEEDYCEPKKLDAEDIAFILYTSGCVKGDTLVQTSSGKILPIKELNKKEGILSFDLNKLTSKVDGIKDLHSYFWPLPLYKIYTSFGMIELTPSHPLFVLNENLEIEEKEASQIEGGDVLILPIPKIEGKEVFLEIPKVKKIIKKVKLPRRLDENLAELIGYFAGDGNFSENCLVLTDKDVENLKHYNKIIRKVFGTEGKIKKEDRQRLLFCSKLVKEFIKVNFPEICKKSKEREVPQKIQVSKNEIIRGFIRGFFDAEGTVSKSSVKIVSTSKVLIEQIKLLLLRLGILSSYYERNAKTKFKDKIYRIKVFSLRISDKENLKRFYEKIGFNDKKKKLKLEKLLEIERKGSTNIEILKIDKLLKEVLKEVKLPKKLIHSLGMDGYKLGYRKIKRKNLVKILDFLDLIEKRILGEKRINKKVLLLRLSLEEIAKKTGYSKNSVHKFLYEPSSKFKKKIEKLLEEREREVLRKIKEWKEKILKIINAEAFFVRVKKVEVGKFEERFIYDITSFSNSSYIANGFFVHNTTGKPKGIVHAVGGYMVQAYITAKWIFDLHDNDIFWSTADIGWITGHTYSCYGPLLNGATFIIYEGALDWPTPERWAQIMEKYGVTIFYTAPTAVRMFEKYDGQVVRKFSFKTLRLLGSVGEPINEEAWYWFFKEVGKERCPIVDTWWQTETGGVLLTSLPGIGPFKPTYAGLPFPPVKFEILDEKGKPIKKAKKEGSLVILKPFAPGMLRGVYRNPERYFKTYWSRFGEEIYYTSDGAFKDKNGLIKITGRLDDVLKVAGHRLSTAELENAITKHYAVNECAIVGAPHEIKGEVPIAFVVLRFGRPNEKMKEEIIQQVVKEIGPIAKPYKVYFVEDLPKTRSGKIMRRILKRMLIGQELGDISTLANPESIEKIRKIVGK
ncbi:MAG: hypothetical protein B6U78_00675 [Candidatus Aenigmarchaeota archaeon ex4484_224]|nr:MAG: hypothetical protein B6U78_00675 [Candidatus Aenigmarchaeota archaeon ex4484_224]